MVHGRHPVEVEAVERLALAVADGDERHFAELGEDVDERPQIESTVQRVHDGCGHQAAVREREIIDVAMHHVEVVGARKRLSELEGVKRERIRLRRIEPQRPRPRRHEARLRVGVAAGEQRDVVTTPNQLVGEPRHHALGATVQSGRYRLIQRRHLSDAHSVAPEMQLRCR